MSRADASLHEYMNKLRRSRDGRSASSTRPGCWRPFRLQRFSRRGPRPSRRKGSTPEGKSEGRAGPSRTTSEPTPLAVGMDIAAHPQSEPTAEENEIFATIPTTKPMVETLELQSGRLWQAGRWLKSSRE
ncbi:hypothetical protein ACSQ67_018656 [Phaseolus vulgaris]